MDYISKTQKRLTKLKTQRLTISEQAQGCVRSHFKKATVDQPDGSEDDGDSASPLHASNVKVSRSGAVLSYDAFRISRTSLTPTAARQGKARRSTEDTVSSPPKMHRTPPARAETTASSAAKKKTVTQRRRRSVHTRHRTKLPFVCVWRGEQQLP